MIVNPASLAVEGVKVANGKESKSNLLLYILTAAFVETLVHNRESDTVLAPIYMPAGYEIPTFIILIAGAIIMPAICALWMKNESKYAGAKWTGRYIATMLADMFLAPSLGLVLLSLFTQEFFPDMDPLTYIVLLPIVMAIVAYYALLVMNQGIKGTVEQIKGTAGEVQAAKDELQQVKPKL